MELFNKSIEIVEGLQEFGPFDVPDNLHILNLKIFRCTSSDLTVWADEKTVVKLAAKLFFNGVLHEEFSPEIWEGGIVNDKSGNETVTCGMAVGPMPLLCICGNKFHPGDPDYNSNKESIDNPNYIGQGSLLHSTITFQNGKDIEDAKLSTDEVSLKEATQASDFTLKTLPGFDDKRIFKREFHTPVPVLPANRSVTVFVEVLNGPKLVSLLLVEVS